MPATTDVLAEHWLWNMQCLHDEGRDVAHCACGQWQSPPASSIGEAAKLWAEHALSKLPRDPALDALVEAARQAEYLIMNGRELGFVPVGPSEPALKAVQSALALAKGGAT